jgi:hypothetical protein
VFHTIGVIESKRGLANLFINDQISILDIMGDIYLSSCSSSPSPPHPHSLLHPLPYSF